MTALNLSGGAETLVHATPMQVWAVLADPTRIGQWSSECRSGHWIGSTREMRPGARFRGINRVRLAVWSKACHVVEARAPSRLVYETEGSVFGRTRWAFDLVPEATGTRITQTYQVLRLPAYAAAVIKVAIPEHADRNDSLRGDLVRLGQAAQRGTA